MSDNGRWLIAITPEAPVADEGRKIATLLRDGWYRVHLRHPGASRREIRNIIESIPQEFHNRIVLHGHFDLTAEFNLGGLHLNHRCPVAPSFYNGPLSRSCHSVDEVMQSAGMAYVTLSPVFDSISKQGYKSAFTPDQLRRLDDAPVPVIALGGVTEERITELSEYNFKGYAMLGAIDWTR